MNRWRVAAGCALLGIAPLLFPLYTANPRLGEAPETLSATLTAHSLVREGNLDLNEYFEGGLEAPLWMHYALPRRGGAVLSMEPFVSSFTFAPLLLPQRGQLPAYPHFYRVGNRAAACIAIATVAMLGLWLLSLVSVPRALVATAVIALATSHRATAGAALWSHTSGVFWLVIGLWLWSALPRRPGLSPLAASALMLAAACRPVLLPAPLLLLVDVLSGGAPTRAKRASVLAVAGLAGLVLGGNLWLYGTPFGGRSGIVDGISRTHGVSSFFDFSPVHWIGLLASPSRGLFVYSPVLLFALPGLVDSLRGARPRGLRLASAAGLLCFGAYGWIATWWAGWVFGPRYMTDLLPFFALWLARTPLPRAGRPAWIGVFSLAFLWSAGVQQLGAARYPCGWNRTPENVDLAHARLWDFRDSQLARCLAKGGERRGRRAGGAGP